MNALTSWSLWGLLTAAAAFACAAEGNPIRGGASSSTNDAGIDAKVDGAVIDLDAAFPDVTFTPTENPFVVTPIDDPNAFPQAPILDGAGLPSDVSAQFGDPAKAAERPGPCVVDPQLGALMPANFIRPRFTWTGGAADDVFEIRFQASSQNHDLLVYTTQTQWTVPLELWRSVTAAVIDEPITISIRSAELTNENVSAVSDATSGNVTIAPVTAEGNIVYWSVRTEDETGELKAFQIGSETVANALLPADIIPQFGGDEAYCIGCHTSTPDGEFIGFTSEIGQSAYANGLVGIETGTLGQRPSFLTDAAMALLSPESQGDLGLMDFSAAHWSEGDRRMITRKSDVDGEVALVWIDLEASSTARGVGFDVIARTGDPRGIWAPAWSNDGATIAYTSAEVNAVGWDMEGEVDVYTVPYNDGAGGTATPLPGASESGAAEFYPVHSSDDALIAFNRVSEPESGRLYSDPDSEIYVIPAAGGTAVRIAANDPSACTQETSPGLTNSWAKWSPVAVPTAGKTYYWLIFSSNRNVGQGTTCGEGHNDICPQLYLAGVVVEDGSITTYPGLYLWNQPADEGNHTPAWDVFQVPVPPPPILR